MTRAAGMRPTVMLCAMAIAHPLCAQGTVDGWTLIVKTTYDSSGGSGPRTVASRYRIASGMARTDVVEQGTASGPTRLNFPAVIANDSAHSTTLLNEKDWRASVAIRPSPVLLLAAQDTVARFVTAPAMALQDIGPAETILGHPTHRYGITISYVERTIVGGEPCTVSINTSEQIWTASDLARVELLRPFLRDAPAAPPTGQAPVQDSLQRLRARREKFINGVVLRSTITATRPGPGGATRTSTSTLEVTELSHGPLERSLFEIPAGYVTTTPPTQPAVLSPAESTARAALRARIDSGINKSMRAALCDPPPADPLMLSPFRDSEARAPAPPPSA